MNSSDSDEEPVQSAYAVLKPQVMDRYQDLMLVVQTWARTKQAISYANG